MHRKLFIQMQRPGRIFLEDDDPRYLHWIRKANRYGRLMKHEPPVSDVNKNHCSFEMEVDGQSTLVLGDPNMNAKTRDALAELIRAAIRAIENGEIGLGENDELD